MIGNTKIDVENFCEFCLKVALEDPFGYFLRWDTLEDPGSSNMGRGLTHKPLPSILIIFIK